MPFDRPSLETLVSRIAADIEGGLSGADARLRRKMLTVLGKALAGAAHGLHGNLDWLSRQVLYDSSDEDILIRQAAVWKIDQKTAVQAQGNIVFTGADGGEIVAGSVLQRSDGAEFATDADAVIDSGEATVAVTAMEAGADGNTADGSTLTLVIPIDDVDSDATVDGGITGGTNLEDPEDLRVRLLSRIRNPPQGGSKADYEAWALEVSGVTRAWVYPNYMGEGTVGICFVCDDLDPIIPGAALVAEVQAHIDELKPVTAQATAFAPVEDPVDITLSVSPDTAAVRAAVEAELADYFRRDAEPGVTTWLSDLHEAISTAEGETNHTLTNPAADVPHTDGYIPVLGDVTWE